MNKEQIEQHMRKLTDSFTVTEYPDGRFTIEDFYIDHGAIEVAEHMAKLWGSNIDFWDLPAAALDADQGCDSCGYGANVVLVPATIVETRRKLRESEGAQ